MFSSPEELRAAYCQGIPDFPTLLNNLYVQRGKQPPIEEIGARLHYSQSAMYRYWKNPPWKNVSEVKALATAMECLEEEHAALVCSFLCTYIYR